MSFLILFTTSGCKYYYVVPEEADVIPSLADPEGLNRYFIVHEGANVKHLKVNSYDSKVLKGELEELPYYRNSYLYTKPDPTESTRYKSGNRDVIQEVHVYMKDANGTLFLDGTSFEADFEDIEKLEIYEHDRETSTLVNIGTFMAGSGGAFVLLVVLIALLKSSCPFLYINHGADKKLAGELYGGAIFKSIERDDFLKLEGLIEQEGKYHLQISNELKEKQYTDQFQLLQIDHDADQQIFIDQQGLVYNQKESRLPNKAHTIMGTDIAAAVATNDNYTYQFNEDFGTEEAVILSFDEVDEDNAQLLLNIKNSYWLDYAFGAFTQKFGSFYEKWSDKQDSEDPAFFLQWMKDQELFLNVSVKAEGEWHLLESIYTFGPLLERDMMVNIPAAYLNKSPLEIKLSSGFMFWELDHASLSSSDEADFRVKTLKAETLIDNAKEIDASILHDNDGNFLAQEVTGDRANVIFEASEVPEGKVRSFFIQSSGYYKHVRDYQGPPDFKELRKFRQPGHFTNFSKDLYRTILEDELLITSAN